MTSERQRELQGDEKVAPRDRGMEVRLALVEERQADLRVDVDEMRADLRATCAKVDTLCSTISPVADWVAAQQAATTEQKRWWEGLVRDAIKHSLGILLQMVVVALSSLGVIAMADPTSTWGVIQSVRKAIGGG